MTDHYSVVEAAVMTKIRTLTPYFKKEWQVSDDDTVIQKGADTFAIFQPDAFPATRANGLQVDFNWALIFDLYVRYSTRKESLARFKAIRSALINLLHPASLNTTPGVTRIVLQANGGLQQDLQGDNPNFIIQTMTAVVTQRVSFDL